MLRFEEELKRFKPSLEVENIEQAIHQEDLADITDIMKDMLEQRK